MSSTRNKRKRTETDARSEGRPKSREQRDTALGQEKKLEAADTAANASKTNPGNNNQVDSILGAVATRYQQAIAQDASVKERDAATGDSSLPIPNSNSNDRHKGPLSQNLSSATKPLYSREKGPACDPSDGGLAHETNRSVRLQGLITHRSSLRRRIRFCAAVASERLQHESEESSYSKFELSAQKGGDMDEVSLFVQMTNSATLAAKRIRADNDANSDRRTSLSLRRGSSVGKRMNAALSSLAPGSSSNHSSSNFATVESNTKVPMNEKEQDLVQINMIENHPQVRLTSSVQQTLPSSNGLVQHANNPDNYSHRILIPSQLKQSKQDQPDKPEANSIDGNSSDNKGPELSSKISNGQESNNWQSSSTNSDRLALPLHLRVSSESLPQNRLTGRDMFSTKFSALRKQCDAIEARLSPYREQTQQNALILPTEKISMKNRLLSQRKTVSLPSRKLTHWDVLLQEMNWMATDFIEERKWKESVSRNISSAISSPSEKFPNSTRSPDDGNEKRREASSRDVAQSLHKDTQSDNGTENTLESVSTCSKLKEISTQTYPRNSQEGDKATRKVGNSIALLITTLGTAVMDTIDKQDFEHKKDSDCNHQNTRSLSGISRRKGRLRRLLPKNGSSISCGFRATLYGQKSFSFLEISGFVDSFAKMKGHQNDSIFQSFSSNSDSHLKMSLSREQKYVVDRVLSVWNQPTKPGIALRGGLCCGKTHTASVLMWQRRKRGPQLLICPTNSMIKWKFAIERLGDIRVLIYNLSAALSGDLSAEGEVLCKASDIILCEFELLDDKSLHWERQGPAIWGYLLVLHIFYRFLGGTS
ncbi:unnamed protein product [Cylindrotheca closterium]|uniref:HSA domain-containing protein n=1 Tax=Cylindrotheca closterium TaxID=2856 RepID=A0AAD2FSV4_9STRA|nr:unnamed protein product [Cylindrotheca closterium]